MDASPPDLPPVQVEGPPPLDTPEQRASALRAAEGYVLESDLGDPFLLEVEVMAEQHARVRVVHEQARVTLAYVFVRLSYGVWSPILMGLHFEPADYDAVGVPAGVWLEI
jgi:hypothetical protein